MSSLPAANKLLKTISLPSTGKLTPYLYIFPAGVFLAAVMGYPIIFAIYMSFHKFTLETLVSKHASFIGLQNYTAILHNPKFLVALTHSLEFTFASIFFQFFIGLALAILLARLFR